MPGVIHKRIFEWREMVRAIRRQQERPRPMRSEFDREAVGALRGHVGDKPIARLSKRLYVVPGNRCAVLWSVNGAFYATPLANAYPAAGGGTAYHVSGARPSGHAVNKHTPFTATESRARDFRRHAARWFYGRDGVWQKGECAVYKHAGVAGFWPTLSMRDALDTLRQEDKWSEEYREWREASASFIKRVGRAVRPFGDVLVRYRISGDVEEIHWHKKMADGMWNNGEMHVRTMTIVELHAPEAANENGMWLRVCCFGKLPVLDSSRPVNYAVYLTNAAANLDDRTPTTEWCITPRASHAIAAAAEWAASKVRIPCS